MNGGIRPPALRIRPERPDRGDPVAPSGRAAPPVTREDGRAADATIALPVLSPVPEPAAVAGPSAPGMIEAPPAEAPRAAPVAQVRREVMRGLRYAHFRANANTKELVQIASTLAATRALLEEKGVLDGRAVESRRQKAAERISEQYSEQGMGVRLDPNETDKYAFEGGADIDCPDRIALCGAACCKLHFALSRQDLDEGTIRWDIANPYMIAQGQDGYCVHLDRRGQGCGAYEARPLTCRGYDCRNDRRIWLDFDGRIINPEIAQPGWPRTASDGPATTEMAPPRRGPRDDAAAGDGAGAMASTSGDVTAAPAPPAVRRDLRDVVSGALNWLAGRPVVARRGGWFLSTYGLCLGVAFGITTTYWLARVGTLVERRLPPVLFLGGLLVAAYVGSRSMRRIEIGLASVFTRRHQPRGGHAFYGGLLAAAVFAAIVCRDGCMLLALADAAAPAIFFGYAVAKLGCIGSGCCIGKATLGRMHVRYASPLSKAVAYYDLTNRPLAPLQLYEALFAGASGLTLALLPARLLGTGRAAGLFLLLLGAGRSLLLPRRHRLAGDRRAGAVVNAMFHLMLIAGGFALLLGLGAVGVACPATPVTPGPGPATPAAIATAVVFAASSALLLFGLRRLPPPSTRQALKVSFE